MGYTIPRLVGIITDGPITFTPTNILISPGDLNKVNEAFKNAPRCISCNGWLREKNKLFGVYFGKKVCKNPKCWNYNK